MADRNRYITAEEAIFETERCVFGLGEGGLIGTMNQQEVQKFAEFVFADEGGVPDELRPFFGYPEEGRQ